MEVTDRVEAKEREIYIEIKVTDFDMQWDEIIEHIQIGYKLCFGG